MIHALILWMGTHFTAEQYAFWTRVECVAWTSADLLILFYFVRLANLARTVLEVRGHFFSYLVLGATALFLPLIAMTRTGGAMFVLELLVTVPHFLLILYLCASNFRVFPAALRRLLASSAP